jgi:hypothetical protein
MPTNEAPLELPAVVRRLDTSSSCALVDLVAIFEDLQMVLRCCERLVTELSADEGEPDSVLVEAVWTEALLSYARCFSVGETRVALTEEDLTTVQPKGDVLAWHQVLMQLRDHYADPAVNPRERFSVGVSQDSNGSASGVAITSVRQPLVDDLTVRQTGAIAYALSGLVDGRVASRQEQILKELKGMSAADLGKLAKLDVSREDVRP